MLGAKPPGEVQGYGDRARLTKVHSTRPYRSSVRLAGLLVTVAIAVAAFAARVRDQPIVPVGAAANVLVVVIDTLRADALGCYGARRPTSPRIDALASRSFVFEQAFSSAPWTLPAMASLFTGTYPSMHGQTESQGPRSRLSPDLVTLAEALRAAGHETIAFSAHPWVSPSFGFGQGFTPEAFHMSAYPGGDAQVTANALQWLDARRETAGTGHRFFAYLHYMRPHSPYNPTAEAQHLVLGNVPAPPPFSAALARAPTEQSFGLLSEGARGGWMSEEDAAYLRALYDAEVRLADDQVGAVLEALRARGLEDETLVVITSDHGEAFLEHGEMVHGSGLHKEMLHVPLILKLPGQASARRITHRVQNVDVMPTILEALGLPVPAQVQGSSVLPGGPRRREAVFAEAAFGDAHRHVKLMKGRFSFVGDPRSLSDSRLHDLLADSLEVQDVAARHPSMHRRLRQEADRFSMNNERRRVPLARTAPVIDEETGERVRALGYVH